MFDLLSGLTSAGLIREIAEVRGQLRDRQARFIPQRVHVGDLVVSGQVHVDLSALDDYIHTTADNERWITRVRLIKAMAAKNQLPVGVIPQSYHQIPNGRIVGSGGFAIQNAHENLRTAAMNGYWDYDFTACHQAILAHFGDYPRTQALVDNPRAVREMVAADIGCEYKPVKTSIIAVLFGADDGLYEKKCAVAKNLGRNKVRAFWDHPWVSEYYNETVDAGRKLVGDVDNFHVALSNKLQNIESQLLAVVSRDKRVDVPMYDGFMSTESYDTAEMERLVEQETGYRITITKEKIRHGFSNFEGNRATG
ncbi:hypothetical protein QWY84_10680 [Aquisalimonas lutea]|uniref:hypothetical protein n=1 Tax=Aquisalimonas lutea TaxID=1327750 RepID=UPI0025B51D73|nr:hypothetical protein [Aquisalimonas lutea]MDN3518075.1 hypothetical protein [Aquisalimonas lutea]